MLKPYLGENMPAEFLKHATQQSRRIGTRLMSLYLLLLLFPVAGIGLYGHLTIRNALTENALSSRLDEVTIRALTLDSLLDQIHADILYLEQRVRLADADTPLAQRIADPTIELNGIAVSHPLYSGIAQVNAAGEVQAGYLTPALSDWVNGSQHDLLLTRPANTIQFSTLQSSGDGTAHLIAGVRLQDATLLIDISVAYLLQSLSSEATDDRWALLISPNTLLTLSDEIQLDALGLGQMTASRGTVSLDGTISLYHVTGPGESWILVHNMLRGDIIPNMLPYYLTLFFIIMGGLIAVGGLALLSISRMITPVYQLENMVKQIRSGVARPPLPETIPVDEFGNLMLAFDDMAQELENKRRREHALIEQLIRAQEEERKLIAYDLHDGLIQSLVGARFYLGQVRGPAEKVMGDQAGGIAEGFNILTDAIAEGRRIMQGLQPMVLEDLGLAAALNELGRSMKETANWQLHMDIVKLPQELDSTTSVILYRITQEALNNIFKHAGATTVWLTLTSVEGKLHLSIRDDGCGFDINPIITSANGSHGWGIRTMRERASMLNGSCVITSKSGKGTTICVTIPYQLTEKGLTA